jgi:uroporphyrinogen-III decarboxylase
MHGRERILAHLAGASVNCLPAMPITMTFAARGIGASYLEYCTDSRVQVEGQISVADAYGHHDAGNRYIVGAGCEVPRDTPDQNLRALIRYAREHTPEPASQRSSL